MEDGVSESLLQSERNGQGNSAYFSNGIDESGDRIPGGYSIGGESGISGSGSGSGTGDENLFKGADEVQRFENSFEDMLSSNRSLIEGLRGIFAFLVLYDHFHNPRHAIASAFTADTYLFVMISGFTTSLQLRESPRFENRKETDDHIQELNTNTNDEIGSSSSMPKKMMSNHLKNLNIPMPMQMNNSCSEENDNQDLFLAMSPGSNNKGFFSVLTDQNGNEGGLKLLPRNGFKIIPFIVSRLVGLLPILWLALLLNIVPWVDGGVGTDPRVKASCTVLYVIGMQSWWRPACHYYGPNNVLYASIILNCFILYAFGRLLIITVQDYFMTWASEELSPVSLKPPRRILRTRSWSQWIGDKMIVLSFNRTDMPTMLVMLLFWFMAGMGMFTLMLHFTFAKVRKWLTEKKKQESISFPFPLFLPYFFTDKFIFSHFSKITYLLLPQ